MKAFVTGATGFLGRRLVAELLERGHEVTVLARPSAEPGAELAGAHVVRGDLRRPDDAIAEAVLASDVVFHVAAVSSGNWRGMFAGTVLPTEWLLGVLRGGDWRGRLVLVSTFSVYGLNQVPEGAIVDENTPLEPEPGRRGDYAWTKWLQERMVRAFAREGEAEVVIVRPGAIYGPGRAFQERLGRRVGSRLLLLLGGRTLMPLNHVDNAASLLAECGENPAAAGEVFNAVDPDPPTQLEYFRWWRAGEGAGVLGLPVPLAVLRGFSRGYAVLERRTGGAVRAPGFFDPYVTGPVLRRFRFATDKPQRILGWTPPVDRDEARRRTFTRGR